MMGNQNMESTRKHENFWINMRERRKKRQNGWDNARLVLADLPLNIQAVKRILPWGIRPSDPPMATFFMADYPEVAFPILPYKEAALLIHVRTVLGSGRHCCWIIVDDDPAMILGRELLGYPKKTGLMEFEEHNGNIRCSVSRRNVKVAFIEAVRGKRENSPAAIFDYKTFHVGGMGQFMAFNPIWLFRPREIIRESFQADVKMNLNDSEFDPIARLVAGEPQNGRIVVMDITGSSPYMLPIGCAGPAWFGRTFNMRFR